MAARSIDDINDEGAQSGYAEHAHWCDHVAGVVRPFTDLSAINPNSNHCSLCSNASENWLCLTCHAVFCGRFAQRHMLEHAEATGHCVAAGFGDLSFWCYRCESYLYHRTIPPLYAAYAALHQLKFNEPPIDPPLPSAEPRRGGGGEGGGAGVSSSSGSGSHGSSNGSGGGSSGSSSFSSSLPHHSASSSSSSPPADDSQPPSRAISTTIPTSMSVPVEGLSPLQLAHPLIQRICGILYGNALGDAFGLSTEFMDRVEVNKLYGARYDPATGEGSIPFPDYILSAHSRRWDRGDWTDDSDQMLLILECILEGYAGELNADGSASASAPLPPSGVIDPKLFASKLKRWARHGFPELGDKSGMGLGALTHAVLTHPLFESDPHAAAMDVWNRSGRRPAANGALMRTSVTGVWEYENLDAVVANTRSLCLTTHADPRCILSCITVALILARMLQGAPVESEDQVESLIQECVSRALSEVPDATEEHRDAFGKHVAMRELGEMELDEPRSIGYTLKCLASGLFGLRNREGFIPTLTRLVREAGDADTNGAVCGALVGARLGYDGLPAEWLAALPNKRWMDQRVVRLIRIMMARYDKTKRAAEKMQHAAGAAATAAAASN